MTTQLETRTPPLPATEKPDFEHAIEARLVVAIIAMLAIAALALVVYGHATPGI